MTMRDIDLKTTAEDILTRAIATQSPGTVTGMRSYDNHRGELDALRVSTGEMLILHGGEFRDGPTYYAGITGSANFGGEFRADSPDPIYLDTTHDAMRLVTEWLATHADNSRTHRTTEAGDFQ